MNLGLEVWVGSKVRSVQRPEDRFEVIELSATSVKMREIGSDRTVDVSCGGAGESRLLFPFYWEADAS